MLSVIFVTLIAVVSSDTNGIIEPCKQRDWECMTKSAKVALPKILSGVPELGIASSDPLHLDLIEGNLSTMEYKFTDSTATGFTNCEIHNVKLDVEAESLHFNLTCRDVKISGKYKLSGRLLILPVEGEGDYNIHCKRYEIGFEGDIKRTHTDDGKDYFSIKKYKYTSDPFEGITYDLKNLFNGQKDLADAVLLFANQNWKEVADYVQGPVISAGVKKLISNVNKYIKTVPADELVLPN